MRSGGGPTAGYRNTPETKFVSRWTSPTAPSPSSNAARRGGPSTARSGPVPIPRLRYTRSRNRGSLYWRDQNLKFHEYELADPTPDTQDLLDDRPGRHQHLLGLNQFRAAHQPSGATRSHGVARVAMLCTRSHRPNCASPGRGLVTRGCGLGDRWLTCHRGDGQVTAGARIITDIVGRVGPTVEVCDDAAHRTRAHRLDR